MASKYRQRRLMRVAKPARQKLEFLSPTSWRRESLWHLRPDEYYDFVASTLRKGAPASFDFASTYSYPAGAARIAALAFCLRQFGGIPSVVTVVPVAGRIDILLISKVTGTARCLFNVRLCSVATRHHVRSRGSYGGSSRPRLRPAVRAPPSARR